MTRLKTITEILENKHTQCNDCGFTYIAMNAITEVLCPKCDKDTIKEIDKIVCEVDNE